MQQIIIIVTSLGNAYYYAHMIQIIPNRYQIESAIQWRLRNESFCDLLSWVPLSIHRYYHRLEFLRSMLTRLVRGLHVCTSCRYWKSVMIFTVFFFLWYYSSRIKIQHSNCIFAPFATAPNTDIRVNVFKYRLCLSHSGK